MKLPCQDGRSSKLDFVINFPLEYSEAVRKSASSALYIFHFEQFSDQMASLFSTTATMSCAPTNKIHKLSISKTVFTSRCTDLIGSYIVLDESSGFLANRKLYLHDLATPPLFQQNKLSVVCFTSVVARASVKDNPINTPDADEDDELELDTFDLQLDSDSVEIEIEKTGKSRRRIRSKVAVRANLQAIWDILTDYERLADFIPGLAVSRLVEKRENFARLFQIGEQNLAFGLKFNAKGTIDCFEKDLQTLPFSEKRDIEFKMVEGDFQIFEGKWSVEQGVKCNTGDLQSDSIVVEEFQTTLLYTVDVKPKLWLPVRLVEGRLCNEIRTNLSCIKREAEKAFQKENSDLLID